MYPADNLIAEARIREILKYIGEDPEREGLRKTPERVRKSYDEIFGGYKYDPKQILSATFAEDGVVEDKYQQGMVIVRDIQFYSHCEHHMVPFFGKAHVGYIPSKKVVGLSKIARLVDAYARRLQIQERLGKQVADTMMEVLEPLGVMVVIEAEHMCMKMRGIKNPCADTVTSVVRGAFEKPEVRAEFLELLKRH
jgi:GTP cyclohydrolase I